MLVFTAGRELGSVYTLIRRRGMLPNTKVKLKERKTIKPVVVPILFA